ncbi:MAG: SusC/RagA family TonB-linked outer membrane protein [Gemmatimonadaceae bacterium]
MCALIALPAYAVAQDAVTITGRVASAEGGAPLGTASVTVEGLGSVTLTRDDGRYSLVVPAARAHGQQATITARLIGYKAKAATITLAGNVTQDFALDVNPLRLGEIIVTGAGTTSSIEKLGTAVSTVDSSLITRSHENNIVEALAGKTPGVQVNSQSGDPGSSAYIRIRGIKSLSGDAQPLFVVDGVPIDNSVMTAEDPTAGVAAPNRAADINPNDIETVTILKGAAAAAIYGARASDGVVIITTKSGHAGGTHYSLGSNYSFDKVNRKVPLQTTYAQGSHGVNAVCANPGCRLTSGSYGDLIAAGTPTYNHFDEIFETGHNSDNTLSASGGNDKTVFYLSAGYTNQQGVILGPNDTYKRTTVRLKASHHLFDRLTVGGNISYVDGRGQFVQKGSNTSGLLLGAMRTSPNFNNFPYLDTATQTQRSYRYPQPVLFDNLSGRGYDNPLFVIFGNLNTAETNRAYGNVNLNYDATDWLKLDYTLGADYYSNQLLDAQAQSSSSFASGQVFRTDGNNLQIDHNLTATLSHTFSPNFSGTFTLGQNLNARRFRETDVNGQNLVAATPFNLQNTTAWIPTEFKSLVHSESYFGQATADIYNQLYLTAALRNDGFSTFGESNPRAWYPKASAAWTFTNLLGKTDQRGAFSFGKLRAAYGETGKEPGVYATNTVLIPGGFFGSGFGDFLNATQQGGGGLFSSGALGNPNIKPEREKEFEGGADLGFLDQKVDLSLTYYKNKSTDVILPLPIPLSSGYATQLKNGATLQNKGYEVAMNVRPITRPNFSWDLGVNWAKNTTTVTGLSGAEFVSNVAQFGGTFSGAAGAATLGNDIGLRGQDFVRCGRGVVVDGVDIDATSCVGAAKNALYIDASGFPVFDPTDRVISDPDPHWTGSIRTSFHISKFQISALVDHKQGGDIWNGTRGALYNFGIHKDTDIRGGTFTFGKDYPYLSGPVAGPGAGTPVVIDQSWFQGDGSGFVGPSAEFVENGTYTKLREISVAYTFDGKWVPNLIGLTSIDLRVAGRNLATWTKYKGIDPETNLAGAAFAVQGIDYFNNPQTRSIVISVGLNR